MPPGTWYTRLGVGGQHALVQQAALDVLLPQTHEILADFVQQHQIQAGVVLCALEGGHTDSVGCMGGSQGQRRHGGVYHVHASLDALHDAHGSQAGGIVGCAAEWAG